MSKHSLSDSDQDHLRAIYLAGGSDRRVSMGAVATSAGHSPATVTAAAKRLQAVGLIDYRRYEGVKLTAAGLRIALEVVRHHRLIESYLVEHLGYDWHDVHEEADRLEHVISEKLERHIAARVSDPTTDPHGHSIPNESLDAVAELSEPLTAAEPGTRVTVASVSDRDPALLDYVAGIGLVPGREVEVVDRLPFGGPLVVRVGSASHHLGRLVTDSVFVTSARDATDAPARV